MEKAIVDGNIGTVGNYKLEFKGGKLRAEAGAKAEFGLSGGGSVEIDSDVVIDAINKAIPGTIDDAFGSVLKAALKNV